MSKWEAVRPVQWPRWLAAVLGAGGLAVAFGGCSSTVDSNLLSDFRQAQQAFDAAKDKRDFLRVAAMYDRIRSSGVVSGAVLYNQGNAYMRAGQRGRAVACYRLAQRYRPRDPLLDANLRAALQRDEPLAPPGLASRPLIEYVLFWQDWVSYPGKFRLSAASGLLTLLFGLASLFLARYFWKRTALLALLVTLALTISAAYDWYRFEYQQHGVMDRGGVIARKGDAESYSPAFTDPLPEGTEFRVLEQRRDWVRIRLASGLEGWVKAQDAVIY